MLQTIHRVIELLKQGGPKRLLRGIYDTILNQYLLARFHFPLFSQVFEIDGISLDLRGITVGDEMALELSHGVYEEHEAEAIKSNLNTASDTIELGACIGFTACLSNQLLSSDTEHIVVEANKTLIPVLKRNRVINDCDFKINHSAYSTKEGQVSVTMPENPWSGSLHRTGAPIQTVDTIDLESLITQFKLSKINLLVDVEGSEADLINNELDILERYCVLLIIEFHEDREDMTGKVTSNIQSARERLESSKFCKLTESQNVVVYENESI